MQHAATAARTQGNRHRAVTILTRFDRARCMCNDGCRSLESAYPTRHPVPQHYSWTIVIIHEMDTCRPVSLADGRSSLAGRDGSGCMTRPVDLVQYWSHVGQRWLEMVARHGSLGRRTTVCRGVTRVDVVLAPSAVFRIGLLMTSGMMRSFGVHSRMSHSATRVSTLSRWGVASPIDRLARETV